MHLNIQDKPICIQILCILAYIIQIYMLDVILFLNFEKFKVYMSLKFLKIFYLNPNRIRKDLNQIQTKICKYSSGAEIFNPKNSKPKDSNRIQKSIRIFIPISTFSQLAQLLV